MSYIRIEREMFDDPDFLALTQPARWAYVVILGQRRITAVGVLDLLPIRLAHHVGVADVDTLLAELEAHGYIAVDRATSEIAVKSYCRRNVNGNNANQVKGAVSGWRSVMSDPLKAWLYPHLPIAVQDAVGGPPKGVFEEVLEDPSRYVTVWSSDGCSELQKTETRNQKTPPLSPPSEIEVAS